MKFKPSSKLLESSMSIIKLSVKFCVLLVLCFNLPAGSSFADDTPGYTLPSVSTSCGGDVCALEEDSEGDWVMTCGSEREVRSFPNRVYKTVKLTDIGPGKTSTIETDVFCVEGRLCSCVNVMANNPCNSIGGAWKCGHGLWCPKSKTPDPNSNDCPTTGGLGH